MASIVALYATGLLTTLELMFLACVAGHTMAVLVAAAMLSPSWMLRAPARAYVYFLRGTPLLAQMFLLYFGLARLQWVRSSPAWLLLREPFWCAALAFALNTSAYTAEILAGAIRSTSRAEIEAADAFGMTPSGRFRRIVLPSALRRMLPAYANEMILVLHGTALAGAVTVVDLTEAARVTSSRSYAVTESYLSAAVLYGATVMVLTAAFRVLERRYCRHLALSPNKLR